MEETDPFAEQAAETAQEKLDRLNIPDRVQRGDVFPGQWAPVFARSRQGRVTAFPMRWGYSGRKLLINARSETADRLPTFADGFRNRRCLIPMTWYYEWGQTEEGKRPFAIRPAAAARFFLAGLYRLEPGETLPRFTVMTREAAPGLRWIHPRMPVILPQTVFDAWLRPGENAADILARGCPDEYLVLEDIPPFQTQRSS